MAKLFKKIRKHIGANKMLRHLDQQGGGSGFLMVLFVLTFAIGLYLTFLAVTRSQQRTAQGHKDETIATELADEAMDQALSQIRTHNVILPLEYPPSPTPSPSGVPMTITYPVGTGAYSTTANAVISWVMNQSPTPSPLRDIEGNLKYRVQAVVDQSAAVGNNGSLKIKRGMSCDFIVINFGRYMGFIFGNDQKSLTRMDGPYHCNGSLTFTGNKCDWNNSTLCVNGSSVTNTFYDPTYITVVAGSITNTASVTYKSQACQLMTMSSPAGSFNVLTNSSSPSGTYFDGAHGGFAVNPPSIPSDISSLAQVVIEPSLLSTAYVYTLQGTGLTGTGPQTISGGATNLPNIMGSGGVSMYDIAKPGVQAVSQLVYINLSALANGNVSPNPGNGNISDFQTGQGLLGSTDTIAAANYNAALTSTYGLLIYVDGNVGVWGQLPLDTNSGGTTVAGNNNKKVTIICTGNVEILGDVAYSGSPYVAGINGMSGTNTQATSSDVDPNPLVNNPNNDAIAIISEGTQMFVDPYYSDDVEYYVQQGTTVTSDLRIDGFLYCPNGDTGGANSVRAIEYTTSPNSCGSTGGCGSIENFTFHGAISVEGSNSLPSAAYSRIYDPNLKYNLSDIIPSGTLFNAYQDITNFAGLP